MEEITFMALSDTFTTLGNTIINLVNSRLKKDFSNIEIAGEEKIKELASYTVDGTSYAPGEYNVNSSSSIYDSPLFGMCPFSTSQYADLQQYFMNGTTVPNCLIEIGQKIDLSNVQTPNIDRLSIGSALDSIVNNIIGTSSSSTLPLSTVYDNMNYMISDIYGLWSNYNHLVDDNTTVTSCVVANIGKRSDFTWDYFSVLSSTTLWEYANMVDDDLNSLQQAFNSVIQQLEEAAGSTRLPDIGEGGHTDGGGYGDGGYS